MSGGWHLGALVVRGACATYSIHNAGAFRFARRLVDAASDCAENRSRCPKRVPSSEVEAVQCATASKSLAKWSRERSSRLVKPSRGL